MFARPGKVFVTSWYGYLVVSSDDGQHWLSAQLPPEVSGFNLHSIWGSDAANVWAVGDNGIILHSVDMGATWVSQNSGTGEGLNSIWGVGPLELFAAGTTGTVVHTINGGRTWSTQSTGTTDDLYTIWGATRDNVIASGAAQLILQWTGTGWKTASKGTGDTMNDYFNGVWIDGRGNGYAVGNGGLIVHSTAAKTWPPQPSGTSGWLGGIWGPSAVSVFVVGEAGVILHGEP